MVTVVTSAGMGDALLVIVDAGGAAWDELEGGADFLSFDSFCATLAVFLKSHLLLHWSNSVVVLGHNGEERCAFPPLLPPPHTCILTYTHMRGHSEGRWPSPLVRAW